MQPTWTILGCGAGISVAGQNTSSYVLEYGDKLYMFDCGGGAVSSFLVNGFDPVNVDAIFISHTHADHICELSLFIQKMFHTDRTGRLPVYLPEDAAKPIRTMLDSGYLFAEKCAFDLQLLPLADSRKLSDDTKLYAIRNSHLQGNVQVIHDYGYINKMLSYSFLVEIENKRLLYSADLGSLDDIENHLENLDLLVIETMHIDIQQLEKRLLNGSIKQTVLTHIGSEQRENIEKFAESLAGRCKITLAKDNLRIVF